MIHQRQGGMHIRSRPMAGGVGRRSGVELPRTGPVCRLKDFSLGYVRIHRLHGVCRLVCACTYVSTYLL